MTIIEAAKAACLGTVLCHNSIDGDRVWIEGADWHDELERFAQIIRNQALEDAAKCCDELPAPGSCSHVERSLWDVATFAAGDAIRAMKEQP